MVIRDRRDVPGYATGTVIVVVRLALVRHGTPVAGAETLVETAA